MEHGITVAIDQSHDGHAVSGCYGNTPVNRQTRSTWLTHGRHGEAMSYTHNTPWVGVGHCEVVARLQSKPANTTVAVGRLGRASTVRFRANRTSSRHRR